MACSFGLSKGEVSALVVLLETEKWVRVGQLAKHLGKDRSVIQRELASLLEKGLLVRDQCNKEGGGYEYLYRARNKLMIKNTILRNSRKFCVMVKTSLERW